jgi:serine/threonine-protein kinase
VLPDELAKDKERVARFEREAKLLASLNHPNIAIIHGLEECESKQFLVMELVEGETLEERGARGPMPVDDVLPLFQRLPRGSMPRMKKASSIGI